MDRNYYDFNNGQSTAYDCPPIDPKTVEKEARRSISRTMLIFFGYLIASYIALDVGVAVIRACLPELVRQYSYILQFAQIVIKYVVVLSVWLLIFKKNGASCPPSKGKMPISSLVKVFFICWGIMQILSFVGIGVMDSIGSVTGFDYNYILELLGDDTWFTTLYALIIAPFFEELIYRKILIDNTRRHGEAASIILSALCFGLMHGNFYQFFYAVAIGLALGYVYCKTGKIYVTMILHGLLNFVGSTLNSLLLDSIRYDDFIELEETELIKYLAEHPMASIVTSFINIGSFCVMIAAVILLILNIKNIKLSKNENGLTQGRSITVALFNVGSVLCYCAFAVDFADFLIATPLMLQAMGQYGNALAMKLGLM